MKYGRCTYKMTAVSIDDALWLDKVFIDEHYITSNDTDSSCASIPAYARARCVSQTEGQGGLMVVVIALVAVMVVAVMVVAPGKGHRGTRRKSEANVWSGRGCGRLASQ